MKIRHNLSYSVIHLFNYDIYIFEIVFLFVLCY